MEMQMNQAAAVASLLSASVRSGKLCAGIALRCRLRLFVRGKWAEEATEGMWMLEVTGKRFGLSDVEIPLQKCTSRWVQEEHQVLIMTAEHGNGAKHANLTRLGQCGAQDTGTANQSGENRSPAATGRRG